MSIKRDHSRFKNIVKGRIKSDLAKYISHGEIVGTKEGQPIKIPVPSIDIPNFRFGPTSNGVGQGKGEGDQGAPQPGQAAPGMGEEAGEAPGEQEFTVEMSIDDLSEILGESLSLPNIEPRGDKNLENFKNKYTSLAKVGPQGLRNIRSTYKRSLKRTMSNGSYAPGQTIVPIRDDFKFKSPKMTKKPDSQAVIFYMMDVSGSMSDTQKQIVQTEIFWINTWLKKHYRHLETCFIIHDAVAKEVTEEEFYTTTANGGTLISSAYKLCKSKIEEMYNPQDWNIYAFHFSDGDNWSDEDNNVSIKLIKDFFMPIVNSFNYGQVASQHGSGNFLKVLQHHIHHPRFVTSSIEKKEQIIESIRAFLGKGH